MFNRYHQGGTDTGNPCLHPEKADGIGIGAE